jgi:glutamine synthetase
LGDALSPVVDALIHKESVEPACVEMMSLGVPQLPSVLRDNTDRNRTSPFAFTGNKFEFRMPGSSLSVANPNIVLNTAVAETLTQIYDRLKDVASDQMDDAIHVLLKELLAQHGRILFNGNGYTDEWVEEAHRRGLADLKSLPEAMPSFISEKSVDLFTKHHIFTKEEIESRYEILLENYAKTIHIESLTLQEMVRKDFTAGLVQYMKDVTNEALKKRDLLPDSRCSYESRILQKLDETSEQILAALDTLEADTKKAEGIDDILAQAAFYQETILAEMETLRGWTDQAEAIIPDQYLPYPTYEQILFSLR